MKLTINGKDMTCLVVKDGALLVRTWGDLLDCLETEHLKAGECITGVIIGGEEKVDYRGYAVSLQLLKNISEITITTGNFDIVVRESLTELCQELGAVIKSVGEIVLDFENRRDEIAYAKLAELLESIKIFFMIFSEDLGWAEVPNAEISQKEISVALERALTQLTAAQESKFWVSICDVLEYEIEPILASWHLIAVRTLASLPPTPPTPQPKPKDPGDCFFHK